MTIIKKDNGFFEQIINENESPKTIPFIDFIYGYENRNGPEIPICTVCIIPYMKEDELYFGIGYTECSDDDFPVKAKGRRLAEARARGAIKAKRNLTFKDWSELSPPICGISIMSENAFVAVENMQFIILSMTKRVQKSIDYLRLKITDLYDNKNH